MNKLAQPVLVVEDSTTMRRIIRSLLEEIGFTRVEEAADGLRALQKLRENDFALVMSDWNMAPMTGLELLRRARADARLADVPFIMVTAEKRSEEVVIAKEAGASNYIVKPFNADTLRRKIEAVLGEL